MTRLLHESAVLNYHEHIIDTKLEADNNRMQSESLFKESGMWLEELCVLQSYSSSYCIVIVTLLLN
jgi:hypothetical protein